MTPRVFLGSVFSALVLSASLTVAAQTTTTLTIPLPPGSGCSADQLTNTITFSNSWATVADPVKITIQTNYYDVCNPDPNSTLYVYGAQLWIDTNNDSLAPTPPTPWIDWFQDTTPVTPPREVDPAYYFTAYTGFPTFSLTVAPSQTAYVPTYHNFYYEVGIPPNPLVGTVLFFPPGSPSDLGSSGDSCGCVGAPINVSTGNTYIEQRDFDYHVNVGFGLGLDRTWNSLWPTAHPFSQRGLFGDSWMTTFDQKLQFLDNGDLVRYWRSDGSAWTFQWDSTNLVYNLETPQDAQATLTYDPSSTTYSVGFKNGDQFQFSSTGQLLFMYDALLYNLFLVYDSNNKLLYAQDPLGENMYFQYGNSSFPNLVTAITTDAGPTYQYNYDAAGHLTQVVYPDASQINYQYDANGLLLNVTDAAGKVIEAHTYDNQRRGLTSSKANGVELVTIAYAQDGTGTAQVTNSAGVTTSYQSQPFGGHQKIVSTSGPGCSTCSGMNTSKGYDSNANMTSITDANGNVTTSAYDGLGNVTSTSRQVSLGNTATWAYTYDQFSNLITATDPLGNQTVNTANSFHQLLTTTAPLPGGGQAASTTAFTYDYSSNYTQLLTDITDPLGHQTHFTYDSTYDSSGAFTGYSGGLITSITDAAGNVTSYEYDIRNNRTAMVDALGNRTQFSYDVMNHLTGITWPDQSTQSFTYDIRGRRQTATDGNGGTTTYAYDDADRLIAITDAGRNVTQYAYDNENNVTGITDALGNLTQFKYDIQGRVVVRIFPSGLSESYTYDANGNLTSRTDRNGNKVVYVYDALNRLTHKGYPDSTGVDYVYDLAGRLTQVTDATGTYSMAYDSMGRLTGTTSTLSFLPGSPFTNSYAYDAGSNVTQLTLPDGSTDKYQYDILNRLTGITDSVTGQFTFGYDALGRRTTLTRSNGVNTSYGYDSLSRLLSVLHQSGPNILDGATYNYDHAGNRTAKTNLLNNITEQYGYDALYELTQVVSTQNQGSTTTESYSYDAVGNRLSSLGILPYSYNSSNEITSTPSASYSYDGNGNPLTRTDTTGTTTYTWDFENRLTSVQLPSHPTVSFQYDAFGRRIAKGNSVYVYDGANLIGEADLTGNLVARYTFTGGIDQPLAAFRGGSTEFYQADGLGSVTSLTAINGALSDTLVYDSFGNVTTSTGSYAQPFRYTGREFDSETNLFYYRARYYDAAIGRFINEDPLRFASGDTNFFAYASNSPVLLTDPLGLVEGSAANIAKRQAIATIATSENGNEDWGFYKRKGTFPKQSNKCNLFVYDVTKKAGAEARIPSRPEWPMPKAGEWADKNQEIPNWRPLAPGEDPEPGDVAAFPLTGGQNQPAPFTGHSGIIIQGPNGSLMSISAHEYQVGPPSSTQFFADGYPTTYRRYTGD